MARYRTHEGGSSPTPAVVELFAISVSNEVLSFTSLTQTVNGQSSAGPFWLFTSVGVGLIAEGKMPIRFDQLSSAPARALQIYLILIGCAANQQTITYDKLAQRVGLLTPSCLFVSLGHLSEWCLHEGLAPLTSLAIAEDTGAPGPGHPLPLESLAAQQNRARKFDWYAIVPPAVADLEQTRLDAAE